eukprot:TRINITY_DN14153_c0_g1_i12.p1 TRINITY_DN14153_c0_g1~~TRINITY_DN14153_c0_g1_i12.p1  ORF type:complete len:172 (+),score=39.62 TRINITY_DN14153_c0_g1_i12:100-615(+)
MEVFATPHKTNSTLSLKALTWVRNSHGLFNYEAFEVMKTALKLESNCTLGRAGNEVCLCSGLQGEVAEKIAKVHVKDEEYYVENCSDSTVYDNPLDKLWLVVKSQQIHLLKRITHDLNNGTEVLLKKGDVIKLGRTILRVSDLRFKMIPNAATESYQNNRIDLQSTKLIPE